jgi:isopentenyl-diphosphate delta-isomerase
MWNMEADERTGTERRKSEHIDICLNEDVRGRGKTTGLERYEFRHEALPEIDFAGIDLGTSFLGRPMKTPFVVSSMTGGTRRAQEINRRLAEWAEERGWAMGVGSVRAAVENPALAPTFQIRRYAPTIPIFANLGAVQLNYGYGPDEARRAVEIVGADGLVLHLNSLQEVFQPGGNTRFGGLLARIERLCASLEVPVGVKEVGWGIHGALAKRLADAGAAFIDVAGAGGTSWTQVEKHRLCDPVKREAAEAFADWGLPTADCIRECRAALPEVVLLASGGLTTGVDAAKAIALGADLAGFGRSLLAAAAGAPEQLGRQMERVEWELRAAIFGIGAPHLAALKGHPALRPKAKE